MSAAGLKRWRRGGGGRRKVVLAGAGKHTLRSIARTWRVQSAWLHKREQAGHISAATGRPCRAKQLECHAGLRGEAAAAATWGLAPGATGRQCCTCGGYAGGPGGGEREEAHESAQASKHSRATQLACLPFSATRLPPPEVPFTCGAASCTWRDAATTHTQTTAC